jgi:hypothetical protein
MQVPAIPARYPLVLPSQDVFSIGEMMLSPEIRQRRAAERAVGYLIRSLALWPRKEETVKADDFDRVNIGGLMRCCLASLSELYPNGAAKIAAEGQTLQCKFAPDSINHRMIFDAGVWRWWREAPNKPEPTDELQDDEPKSDELDDDELTREHMRRWGAGEETHSDESDEDDEKDESSLCAV